MGFFIQRIIDKTNMKTNNLFMMASISLNYSLSMTSKSCATLSQEVLEHTDQFFLDSSLQSIDGRMLGFVSDHL